jgi:glycosyltransferase involved in cell wall biosynthesis
MRVLHVVQNLNYGGLERLVFDLVRLADRERFEPHVLALQYVGRFGEGMEEHARVHLAPPMPRWSMLRPAALARQIAAIAPDVAHTHSGVWWKGSLAARMAGVPLLVHTEHGRRAPDPLDDQLIDGWASRRSDVVAAVSDPLARHLEARVVRGRAAVVVVPNGVDTDAFRPRADSGALRRELELADDVPVLGSVGRLEPIKGYEVAVRALALLGDGGTGGAAPVLVLAGDGSERGRLEALAASLGVGGRVFFLGWRDDLHDLHAAFTLFTMSSHSEGTSVSLLEAMSAGLCPVVTDVGGNAAVLGPELGHRLVRPGEPAALAAAWRRALGDWKRCAADALSARRRVEEHFSARTMVRRYESIYAGRPAAEPEPALAGAGADGLSRAVMP